MEKSSSREECIIDQAQPPGENDTRGDNPHTQYRKFGKSRIDIVSDREEQIGQFPKEMEEAFVDDYRPEVQNGPDLVWDRIRRQENERGRPIIEPKRGVKAIQWKQNLICVGNT